MPPTRALLITMLAGLIVMVLFAFTLIGLVGEAVALLALIGLLLRGACALVARARHVPHC